MILLGKILEIDLDDQATRIGPFPESSARNWLGGRGFNVHYLNRHLPEQAAALSKENILLLSCGLLTGTKVPTSSRLHLNALSPLTGLLGSSNVGGHFGARLRSCGFQSVIVRGRAPHPVVLEIHEGGAAIHDATDLRGLDTHETQRILEQRAGDADIKVLGIGPAGENGSRFACIVTDRDHAAGRTGLGAVMGSKNLKALVVHRGTAAPRAVRPEQLKEAASRFLAQVMQSPEFRTFSKLGGAGYLEWAEQRGLMGVHYFRDRHFPQAARIDGARFADQVAGARGCYRCPVQCKAVLEFQQGRLKGQPAYRPEFEPMINLGAKCGLADLQDLVALDNLCTRLGLDSISAANAIAFAMDLHQRGLLDAEAAGGLALDWGNAETMEALIRGMASGEGLGGLLGQGVQRAARRIGGEAERYAVQIKGLELTAYHPAAMLGTALGYAISSRGGDYNNVYASLEHRWSPQQAKRAFGTARAVDPDSVEGKGKLVARAVRVNGVIDSLGLCKVPTLSLIGSFDLVHEAALTSAVTGWDLDAAELFAVGSRLAAEERRFNLRRGLDPAQDTLPQRFFEDPQRPFSKQDFQQMLQEFYEDMGWDRSGRPTPAGHEANVSEGE